MAVTASRPGGEASVAVGGVAQELQALGRGGEVAPEVGTQRAMKKSEARVRPVGDAPAQPGARARRLEAVLLHEGGGERERQGVGAEDQALARLPDEEALDEMQVRQAVVAQRADARLVAPGGGVEVGEPERLGFGVGFGETEGGAANASGPGGAGGAISVQPQAFIVVTDEGRAHLLTLRDSKTSPVVRAIELVPEVLEKVIETGTRLMRDEGRKGSGAAGS